MMKKGIIVLTLSMAAVNALGAYQGQVFVDANKNGVFDRGEKAMAGVMVSDGLNVVSTDKEGRWNLPGHDKEKFVFITTPSGYKASDAFYRKIEANVVNYDFGVEPYNAQVTKDGSHKFIHISDTEIGGIPVGEHDDWVGNVRDYVANEGAAFVVHTGDICYENGLKNHHLLVNSNNMNTQMFYCIGNHDLVKGESGEALFEKFYGPVFYSFNVGNTHYIVTPMLGGDYRPSYSKQDVYRWLKNDLAQLPAGTPIMVFNHDVLTTDENFIYDINENEFIDLDAHNLKAWVYGHWHVNHIHKHKSAYSVCTSTIIRGGIDHSAAAFRVMKVDGKGDFTSELRYPYIDKSIQIASINNARACVLPSGDVDLSVNAYSTVSPIVEMAYYCSKDGKKLDVKGYLKQQTNFNWQANVPLGSRYEGDFITIHTSATFKNGEVAHNEQSFVYQIEESASVAAGSDWANLLGNAGHTGATSYNLPLPLGLAWVKNIGSNIYMTSPIIYQGAVFAASVDHDDTGKAAISSMNIKTGATNWKYAVRGSVHNTIAASNSLLLAQDVEGYLYAINTVSGKLAWEKRLAVQQMLPTLIEGLVVADGIVYAGTGSGLCAVEIESGKELWRNTAWGQNQGSTATLSVNNGVLIAGSHWGELYAHDATNGKLLWRQSKFGIRHRSSSATMHNSIFYLTSDQSLFIIDARTGRIIAQKELPHNVNVASSPLVTDNEIIFGTATNGVVALDRQTLAEKWNYRTDASIIYTSPYVRNPSASVEASAVAADNTIFVGASDGNLYALDKEKGTLMWKHSTGAPIMTTAAISGNTIVVADFGGNVYAFTSSR